MMSCTAKSLHLGRSRRISVVVGSSHKWDKTNSVEHLQIESLGIVQCYDRVYMRSRMVGILTNHVILSSVTSCPLSWIQSWSPGPTRISNAMCTSPSLDTAGSYASNCRAH